MGFFVVLNGSALILKIHTDIIIQTKEEIMENKFEWKFTDIYKTKVCPLAKVMRRELKKKTC